MYRMFGRDARAICRSVAVLLMQYNLQLRA